MTENQGKVELFVLHEAMLHNITNLFPNLSGIYTYWNNVFYSESAFHNFVLTRGEHSVDNDRWLNSEHIWDISRSWRPWKNTSKTEGWTIHCEEYRRKNTCCIDKTEERREVDDYIWQQTLLHY